ncbi:MAG TPA: TMEM43 family protein [Polyangiaceae bacterium]|jgi:hypothetical protein|nr:TMEM43 family protein [Polyangiaceae bacterium]
MSYSETQSYGSRILESIKGVLFGILLFLVSVPLLWWNEGRAVRMAKSLAEGAAHVVSVTGLDAANESKLVHFTGDATTSEVLEDKDFGVRAPGLRLERQTQMYQWYETSASHDNVGGSKTTVYSYDRKWSDRVIPSAGFKEAGHTNPATMGVAGRDFVAAKASLGQFDLSPEIVRGHVDKWEPFPVSLAGASAPGAPPGAPPDLRGRLKQDGDAFYFGDNPSLPKVGDVRIAYRRVPSPVTMSIVAKQAGRGFVPYPAKAGDAILLTAMESKDASAMFTSAVESNETLTWILRAVGWVAMTLGVFLIFRPIAMVANFIPFIGSTVSFGAFFLSAMFSSCVSLVIVALAWIFYRPLIGLLLFGVAMAAAAVAVPSMAKARSVAPGGPLRAGVR